MYMYVCDEVNASLMCYCDIYQYHVHMHYIYIYIIHISGEGLYLYSCWFMYMVYNMQVC